MNINKLCYALAAACALAGAGQTARAENVHISLNLFYDSLANQSAGGSWELVAKTDAPFGIAAINAILAHVDNGIAPDEIFLEPDIGAIDPIDEGGVNERPAYLPFNGGIGTDLIYGQDISNPGSVVVGVGTLATSDGPDPFGVPFWDDATRIATGTFDGAVRPFFTTNGSSTTDANILSTGTPPFAAAAAGAVTAVVRIPEPSTLLMVSVAILGLMISCYRRPAYARAVCVVARGS